MALRRLGRDEARQLAVRAQLLDADRPSDLVAVVEHLTQLQIDPIAAVAPSADLVAWSRIGGAYETSMLTRALEERRLFELRSHVRPMSAVGLHVPEVTGFTAHPSVSQWLDANDGFRRDVLARLEDAGPLVAGEIDDTSQVGWGSTGWTNQRNVNQMLELLSARGQVAVSGRAGRQRLWDLSERVYGTFKSLTPQEASRQRARRRLACLGLARAKSVVVPGEPTTVSEAGLGAEGIGDVAVKVEVDGVEGEWWADRDTLDRPFVGRTALLSPFDRLVYDRERAQELFDFTYVLEMYKPAAKRRWGYFALPVLHHDRLVGKLDAKTDRRAGTLTVHALHEDVRFTKAMRADVEAEIDALAYWLGVTRV